MARLLYGCTAADYTITSGGRVIPNTELTVWDAIEGGTQITDLTDYDGNAVGTVTSEGTGFVRFYGPDGENDNLWLDSGQNSRVLVRPTVITADLGDGSILDEDINAAADIDRSKIAGTALTTGSTGVFSVLDYGATGDGETDDTDAIQAAIDAAAVSGGTVVLPPGDYLITAALEMANRVSLRGTVAGSEVTPFPGVTITPTTNGQTAILLPATPYPGIQAVTFSDFTIVGDATANGYVGIEMRGSFGVDVCAGVTFERLHFYKIDTAIWSNALTTGWDNSQIRVVQCRTDEVNTAVHLTSPNNDLWTIDNCTFNFFDAGIHLEASGFVSITNSCGGAVSGNADSSYILADNNGPLTVISSQAESIDHFYRMADGASSNPCPQTFIGCVANGPFTLTNNRKLVLIGCQNIGGPINDASTDSLIIGAGNSSTVYNLGASTQLLDLDEHMAELSPSNLVSANQASLETDTTGWTVTNTLGSTAIARVTSDHYVGAACLELTANGAGSDAAAGTPRSNADAWRVFAVAGRTYTAALMAKSATRSCRLRILWWNAAGGNLGAASGSGTAVTDWTELTVTGIAPADTAYASIEVDMTTNGSAADTALLDRLGFWEGSRRGWRMPLSRAAVTGSRGGNAALASLITQLAALGLVTDTTTAS